MSDPLFMKTIQRLRRRGLVRAQMIDLVHKCVRVKDRQLRELLTKLLAEERMSIHEREEVLVAADEILRVGRAGEIDIRFILPISRIVEDVRNFAQERAAER